MDANTTSIIGIAITTIGTIMVAIISNRTKNHVKDGAAATEDVKKELQEVKDELKEVKDEVRETKTELKATKSELTENNLETLATDITVALEHHEDDVEPLIELGRKYFTKLGGNSHISKPYAAWALKHCLDISEFYTEHNNLKLYMENPKLLEKGK